MNIGHLHPRTQVDFGELDLFLFTTRGHVCLSVLLHPVHTLPSKSGPVFSSYPDMQRVPHVHTKNRAPLSPGHLAWTISGGSARSKRDFHSEASAYLSQNDRLIASMFVFCHFLTSLLWHILFSSQILPLSLSSPLYGSSLKGFHLHSTCPDSCTVCH